MRQPIKVPSVAGNLDPRRRVFNRASSSLAGNLPNPNTRIILCRKHRDARGGLINLLNKRALRRSRNESSAVNRVNMTDCKQRTN
jgi:hypothetical protein